MNNSLLDGLYLFVIGIFVVFIVLILILISIKLLTFFENKTYGKQISENKNLSNEKQDSLLDIAAAIAVSLFQKSKNKTIQSFKFINSKALSNTNSTYYVQYL